MGRKNLTTEDIKERIYSLEGNNYELLSDYVNAKTKVKIKHVACGNEYEVFWGNFQQGSRCPKCNGKHRYTDNEIDKLVSEMTNGEYTKLSEYKNANTKFSIRHNKCGHEYEATWGNFQQSSRCPKCNGSKHRYTDNEIDKLVSEITNGEYIKLSTYKNSATKFKIKHNLCGHVYEIAWNTFQSGVRCPKCAGVRKLTNKEIVQRIFELVGDEYTKLDNSYINSATKFKIKHNLCGHEYMVNWNTFQQGYRCPKCNQSKGEKFIQDYLTNQGISFATQVKFDDCRYKLPLPFDFAIMDDNRRIVALIEFDGEQHYKSVDFFGGEEKLQQTQIRDSIKNRYCQDNKIPLLRIRYDEQDISKVIEEFITQERVG